MPYAIVCHVKYSYNILHWRLFIGCNNVTSKRLVTRASKPMDFQDPYTSRVVGAMLGKMCGDVLGASVEGWDISKLQKDFPDGLTEFQQTERGWVDWCRLAPCNS